MDINIYCRWMDRSIDTVDMHIYIYTHMHCIYISCIDILEGTQEHGGPFVMGRESFRTHSGGAWFVWQTVGDGSTVAKATETHVLLQRGSEASTFNCWPSFSLWAMHIYVNALFHVCHTVYLHRMNGRSRT